MRKSRLEVLKEQRQGHVKTQTMNESDFLALLLGGPPLPTQAQFINAYLPEEELAAYEARGEEDPGWAGAYMGPYGCAKTSTLLAKAWLQALYEPGSQILVARQNFNDLKDTTYKRMEEMLSRLPPGTLISREKSPPIKWVVQPINGQGEFSSFTFMGLMDSMGSYEFHSGFIDECDEVDAKRFEEVFGRCRLKGKSRIVACAFNPPSEDHWLYQATTGKDAKGRQISKPTLQLFRPIPLENSKNVRSGYYESLRARYPPDMVRRLVDGEWGSTFRGQPVYGSEFKRSWHMRDDLAFDPFMPMFRFWDFGYRFPFCIWAQPTEEGGLNVLREEMGGDVEVRPFAARCKIITATEFPGIKNVIDFGDPAARQRKDTGSTLAHLSDEGIQLRFIIANIEPGVRAVRYLLSRATKGEPAFKIHRRCIILVRALEGGYHYPEDGVGDQLKPVKDGYYDHCMDALRYGITNVFGIVGNMNTSAMATMVDRLPENVSYKPEYDTLPAGIPIEPWSTNEP